MRGSTQVGGGASVEREGRALDDEDGDEGCGPWRIRLRIEGVARTRWVRFRGTRVVFGVRIGEVRIEREASGSHCRGERVSEGWVRNVWRT